MRSFHAFVGLLGLSFIALIVGANTLVHMDDLSYFMRSDVVAMLGLALTLALVLFWASSADAERHRIVGSIASAGMTGLFLGTISLPILAVPFTLVGSFRAPRSRQARVAMLGLIPIAVAIGVAVPWIARGLW